MRSTAFVRPLVAAIWVGGYFQSAAANGDADTGVATGGGRETIVITGQSEASVTLGSKTPIKLRETPNSVSVVTQRRIEDQKLLTVADALENVLGVTVIPNDGTQSQYRARGYSLSVLNDGVPALSALSGLQQFDLSIYERLEILRGPAGVLQGSSDPGGVLNLVRKRGLRETAKTGTVSAGSWNDRRVAADITGPLNEAKSLRGRAVASHQQGGSFMDTFRTKKDVAYVSIDWDTSPNTRWGAYAAWQEMRVEGSYQSLPAWLDGPLLDVPRSTNVAQDWERNRTRTYMYSIEARHDLGAGWFVSASGSRRDQRLYFKDAFPNDGVRRTDYTLPYVRREYDFTYVRTASDIAIAGPLQWFGRTHSLVVGYNYDQLDNPFGGVSLTAVSEQLRIRFDEPRSLPAIDLPYDEGGQTETRQSGFYTLMRLTLSDSLKLVASARVSDFDARTRSIPPASPGEWRSGNTVENKVTPHVGVVFDVNQSLSTYGSYSESFVPQSTQRRADGNPLVPREGQQFEVGAKAEWLGGRMNASLALYKLRDQNRSLADLASPGFFLNAGEVEAKGWEAEIFGAPAPGYDIQVGYARLDTRFVRATAAQQGRIFDAFEPRHSLKIWAVRRFQNRGSSGVTIGAGVRWQSDISSAPERTQNPYAVANLLIGYRFSKAVSADLNVSNLLDKSYYARLGGTNSNNIFGPPRSVSITLKATL